jgi:hypothetical protein
MPLFLPLLVLRHTGPRDEAGGQKYGGNFEVQTVPRDLRGALCLGVIPSNRYE